MGGKEQLGRIPKRKKEINRKVILGYLITQWKYE
jgi:hypothetical protein